MTPDQIAQLAAQGAVTIRTLQNKVASLTTDLETALEQLAARDREDKIASLATEMEERGLNTHLTREQKIASLRLAPNLDDVDRAVRMADPATPVRIALPEKVASGESSTDQHLNNWRTWSRSA